METPFHAGIVHRIVQTMLDDAGWITSSSFARRAGVSRQTAHAHLTRLVERGVLRRTGKGRATCYLPRGRTGTTPEHSPIRRMGPAPSRLPVAARLPAAAPPPVAMRPALTPVLSLVPVSADADRTPETLWLKVLEHGCPCLTAADARDLLRGLERFGRVLLDFGGVLEIGEDFAIELLQGWALAHASVRLEPVNTLPAVRLVLARARIP